MLIANTIFLIFITAMGMGFASAENFRRDLMEDGFENVSIVHEDRRLIVTYENRVYRHEMRAIREVMAALSPLLKEGMSVTLIPQSRGVPLFSVTIPAGEYLADVWENPPNPLYKREEDGYARGLDSVWKLAGAILNGASSDEMPASGIDASFDVGTAWRKVQNPHGTGFWSHRFGILLHPQFSAEYGDDTELVIYDFNLVPEANASLWKGMLLTTQLVIPVHNELDQGGDYLRPGLLTLNQVFRLPYSTFASATLGYFTQRRYGADLQVRKYFSNGRLSVGADVGYTGYAAYIDGVWFYSRVGLLTGLFDVEYRLPLFELGLRATLGRFLYRDKGFRVDFFRQCDEVRIGFFAHKTEGGENAGVAIRIPIFPSKHLSIGSLRIGTGKEFRQEYRYRGFLNEGVYYDTGNSVDRFMKRLSPDYVASKTSNDFDGFDDFHDPKEVLIDEDSD